MPEWMQRLWDGGSQKNAAPRNTYEGFQPDGAVVMSDRRGARKAELPTAVFKSESLGDDPLAIYKPTGAKHVDASKAMANFTGWTFAAVNAIASEIANIEWRLYQVEGKTHVEVTEHELLDLLDAVNPGTTGIELKYVTAAHLELTGNCYWLLDGVSDAMSLPKAIYPLNPGRVSVKLNKSRFPYTISHYEFTIDGKKFTFQPFQIVHLKYPDPNDPYVGIGIPQTIPTWIDSDNYAMEYNRKFFINGAQVGLYIQSETNVEANIDRIKRGFADTYTGNENAHKIPVLPKGAKLEHTGLTQKDMDFEKLTTATRDRILAAFRVSKTILGTAESDTNRSTAETADYVFSKRTIKPKMLLIVSYLNEYLVPRYGDNLYLTFVDPVPEDRAARAEEMNKSVGGMPVMTQNEARRAYLGLGPVEGGDKLVRPGTMAEVGATSTPEGEDQTPQLARTITATGQITSPIRVRTGGKTVHSSAYRLRNDLAKAFQDALTNKMTDEYEWKSAADMSHEEYMVEWRRFNARSERAEMELRQAFHLIHQRQMNEVIENLPDATGITKALDEAALYDSNEFITLTIDLVTPILMSLARDEATAALAMVGAQHRDIMNDTSIRAALEAGIEKMARAYDETTRKQLVDILTEKMTQEGGTNLAELTDAVQGVFSYADEKRARRVARTEAYRAGNWANLRAWEQSGVVTEVRWYTAEDQRVCPQCAALDNQIVSIGAKFFDDDYADGDAPPLHPDCRCYLRPETISLEEN